MAYEYYKLFLLGSRFTQLHRIIEPRLLLVLKLLKSSDSNLESFGRQNVLAALEGLSAREASALEATPLVLPK